MTSKRKHQTVQFLFEASPENNITRCVISSTRSSFENGEEWDQGNDRCGQIAANTTGNNKELNDLQHRSLTGQAPNAIKENDGDYMKTQDEYGNSHSGKEILQGHSEGSSTPDSDGGKTMINGNPEAFSHHTIETSNFKNVEDHNYKEGATSFSHDSYNTKRTHKSQGQEIRLSKTTISASPVDENHNNFHNVTHQSPLSNPKDNKTKEQFPVVGGSNHNKGRHEITKLSLDVGGKYTHVINNSNAKFCDDSESKHLHAIDYDVHEAVPDFINLDSLESRNGYTNGVGNKASDGFNEGYNDLNRKIEQTDKKSIQAYNPVRQLSAQGNPRRLAEKQIKLHANMPSNNNGKNTEIERSLNDKEPPANKVRSLIDDYEQQVQEKCGERKEKHEHQFGRVSNVQTVQSPCMKRRHRGPVSSNLGDPSSLIEFSQSHERELLSEKIFDPSAPKASYVGNDYLTTEERNTIDSSNSNTESHLETPRKTCFPSSPVNKTVSGLDDIKIGLPFKVSDTNDRHNKSNTSDLKKQSGVLHNKHVKCLDITAWRPEDLKNASPNRVNDIEDNKHLQPLSSQKTASGVDDFKSISASEVNNTSEIHSTTNEGNTCFALDTNRKKLSLNAKNRDGHTLPQVGKQHATDISNHELSSNGQLQTFADGSHVTRAHWYDIHSPLQQSSQGIQQSIPNGESISTLSPSRTEEPIKSHFSMTTQNVVRGESDNDGRQKRWKSLGELNTIDHVEEYRLPEKLSKTVAYATDKQAMFDRNNNIDTTYFSTIPSNREFKPRPKTHAIQKNQRVNLSYDGKGTKTVSLDSKTVHQLPFPTANHTVAKMNNTDNPENMNSNFDNSSVQIHKSPDTKEVKLSPSLERQPNMYNTASKIQMTGIVNTFTPDYFTANQSPSLIRKYAPIVHHNNTKTLSSHAKVSNISPLLSRQKLPRTVDGVNNHSGLRVSNYNLSSSLNALETLHLSPMERSRLPSRVHEKPSGLNKKFNDSSDSLHEISANQVKNLKGYNNNLSSSLTSLETLDQSPMKRSSKIKHLVNIEYYDINSDEELNSKIRRRPRTKSLNEEYKTVEFVAPTREFRSSGDLRLVGFNNEKMNVERNVKAKSSAVDLNHTSSLRTHGKYTEVYMDSTDKIQRYSPKPGSSIELSRGGSVDRYEKHSQDPLIPNYDTAIDDRCSAETQCGKSPPVSSRPVEQAAQKVNHVRTSNTSNLKTVLQQTKRKIKGLSSPLHTPKTIKRSLNPPESFNNSPTKSGKSTKQHSQEYRDTAHRSIAYPEGNLNASEGKYNVAKAEKEWRKKYGRLPYTNKDPLHQSSDKEFSRLFQNSEEKSKMHRSSKVPDHTIENALLEEKLQDTSSSSLFSPDIQNEDKNTEAKQFTATLNQLSSHVLSGYKGDNPQTPTSNNQEKNKAKTSLKYKRYYLDDEGDLSYILDDLSESPKVSMLVHTIIRLREVYSIQHYAKPQTPSHPINLGNPQMRDAIQNKPMSVVKDLILANKSVDVNIQSQSGNSALHRAAIEGDIDAIRIMINHGANVNIRDRYGFPPVNRALRCHHYKAAMFLMDCDTDLMSYTSKRIQEFVNVKAIAKQYLRQTLKTPL